MTPHEINELTKTLEKQVDRIIDLRVQAALGEIPHTVNEEIERVIRIELRSRIEKILASRLRVELKILPEENQ